MTRLFNLKKQKNKKTKIIICNYNKMLQNIKNRVCAFLSSAFTFTSNSKKQVINYYDLDDFTIEFDNIESHENSAENASENATVNKITDLFRYFYPKPTIRTISRVQNV